MDMSDQWAVGPMGYRTSGLSDQWAIGPMGVGPMGCRTNGLSEQRAVPISIYTIDQNGSHMHFYSFAIWTRTVH